MRSTQDIPNAWANMTDLDSMDLDPLALEDQQDPDSGPDFGHTEESRRNDQKRSWFLSICQALCAADLLSTVDCSPIRAYLGRINSDSDPEDVFRVVLLFYVRITYEMESLFQLTIPRHNIQNLLPHSMVGAVADPVEMTSELKKSLDLAISYMDVEYCPTKYEDSQARGLLWAHDSTGKCFRHPRPSEFNKDQQANQAAIDQAFAINHSGWWNNSVQRGFRDRNPIAKSGSTNWNNYVREDKGVVDVMHYCKCDETVRLSQKILDYDLAHARDTNSYCTSYRLRGDVTVDSKAIQSFSTRDFLHLSSATVLARNMGKTAKWDDAADAMITAYLEWVVKWPILQRLDIGFGAEAHHKSPGFDALQRRLFSRYRDLGLGLIDYQGILGLHIKDDWWHASLQDHLAEIYAEDMVTTAINGWHLYYFTLTFDFLIAGKGHLPAALFQKAQRRYEDNWVTNEDLYKPLHILVEDTLAILKEHIQDKFKRRSQLIGGQCQPDRFEIPLDKMIFSTTTLNDLMLMGVISTISSYGVLSGPIKQEITDDTPPLQAGSSTDIITQASPAGSAIQAEPDELKDHESTYSEDPMKVVEEE